MIYLDTHVVVWLYEGLVEKLSDKVIKLIEENKLAISPIVKLELSYLHEIKRITRKSHTIISSLESRIGLKICDLDFVSIVDKANDLTWTRDPFDRLIVASAICQQCRLITKDANTLKHAKLAIWD